MVIWRLFIVQSTCNRWRDKCTSSLSSRQLELGTRHGKINCRRTERKGTNTNWHEIVSRTEMTSGITTRSDHQITSTYSAEYSNIVSAHIHILELFCLITTKRRCRSHEKWQWPSDRTRKYSKFGVRQVKRSSVRLSILPRYYVRYGVNLLTFWSNLLQESMRRKSMSIVHSSLSCCQK